MLLLNSNPTLLPGSFNIAEPVLPPDEVTRERLAVSTMAEIDARRCKSSDRRQGHEGRREVAIPPRSFAEEVVYRPV